ncbi:tetratricopeptide repeat protein [Pelodictyon phaeoclathratiforme]|uniref:TPR repeat-containing protein n=1 Tax=Pelodictyon phaeoclathratiforme (strain DSM 5477 / BU-1) TaxID=324925 RepID=B4S9Y3_PELPB|nr:tetratricopeptide repeat protein [Pelodictyon phaeoclathratiforme]ACF43679.1 TPR repeat-containing protein [Pelodictyon phaeoclathratiforme BU-1]
MKRKFSVFMASPSDLANERRFFKDAIKQINTGFGEGANVEFEPLCWEDTLASTGRRSQGVINKEIDKCDVFILAMYRRWGQDAPDAAPYTSYTEEEYHRALSRWQTEGSPEIFVFFKRVDAAVEGDPGVQLKKVIDFRKSLENTRKILYHYFDDEAGFILEVDRHLRAYAKGELPKADQQRDIVLLPLAVVEEVNKAKTYAEQKALEAELAHEDAEKTHLRLELIQLQTAKDAAELSKEGKIEYARQKFSELITETEDIRILSLGYEFFYRTGDFVSAFQVLNKWLNISGPEQTNTETASAYGNLGILFQTRGELDRAEEMYLKALTINESLDHKEGMASDYGNLGNLYKTKGELDCAEEIYLKALAINKALDSKEGMASDYGNLGILFQTRGELDRAEEMYLKALTINEALDRKEGMASDYGNLGNLFQTRGELDRAEEMYLKALTINEALGRKEGIANEYGIYKTREERDLAESILLFSSASLTTREVVRVLNKFSYISTRLSLDSKKKALATAFVDLQGYGIEKFSRIFFESGSTITCLAQNLARILQRRGNNLQGSKPIDILTNNKHAYLYLWLCSGVMCYPVPEGPPDHIQEGMYGPIANIYSRPPYYDRPPLEIYDTNGDRLIKELEKEVFPDLSTGKISLFLTTASGLQLTGDIAINDFIDPMGYPQATPDFINEKVRKCRGFYVRSYQDMLFKRCYYRTHMPTIVFLYDENIDCSFNVGKYHFLFDEGLTWNDIAANYPLSIWIACEQETHQNILKKCIDHFVNGDWYFVIYGKYNLFPILIGHNKKFRDMCKSIDVSVIE